MDFNRTGPRPGSGGGRGRGGSPIGPGGGSDPQGSIERLLAGDMDGDDRLTPEELPEQIRRNFDRIDRDGDGYLEPSEIEAMMQRGAGRNRPPGGPGGLMRWDADGDGMLSMEEVPPQMARRFEPLDTNGDGLLDQEELSAMRGQGRGPNGRGNGKLERDCHLRERRADVAGHRPEQFVVQRSRCDRYAPRSLLVDIAVALIQTERFDRLRARLGPQIALLEVLSLLPFHCAANFPRVARAAKILLQLG